MNFAVLLPRAEEQAKIASFLSKLDERITVQSALVESLQSLMAGIGERIFKDLLKEEDNFVPIRDILNYEQPTKYLVANTEYSSDTSLIPVLTANKTFILGYTDENFGICDKKCIVFDDFTMDMKFVDFPFKVKSSAIKILTPKPTANLRFVFEHLRFLNLKPNGHKRHYISEVEPMGIALPDDDKQAKIANILSAINKK